MCVVHLRDSSMWTPRYMADSLISICWPFIVMALGLFLLLLQSTTWVLSVLSSRPLDLHQSYILETCSLVVSLAIIRFLLEPSCSMSRSSA